jgi:hypothetical protein
MRIYSVQAAGAIDSLNKTGVLRCTPEVLERHSNYAGASVSDPWKRRAYDWMAEQLRLQTGGGSQTYPVWAWVKKPSMTGKERRLCRGKFLITAIVPRCRLLISDYGQWHNCLNGGPVTISEQEFDHFDQLEKTCGEATWISLMQSTWHRIFDFELREGEQPRWRFLGRNVLQACIEDIRLEEIVRIRPL